MLHLVSLLMGVDIVRHSGRLAPGTDHRGNRFLVCDLTLTPWPAIADSRDFKPIEKSIRPHQWRSFIGSEPSFEVLTSIG